MNACYSGEEPILMHRNKSHRLFRWMCNAIVYATKVAICVIADERLQFVAFSIFMAIALIQSIDVAYEQYSKALEQREGTRLIIYEKEAWQQLFRNIVWHCCSRKKRAVRKRFERSPDEQPATETRPNCRQTVVDELYEQAAAVWQDRQEQSTEIETVRLLKVKMTMMMRL